MKTDYLQQLTAIVNWFIAHPQQLAVEFQKLIETIYIRFYCGMEQELTAIQWGADEAYIKKLSAANLSKESIDLNWTVKNVLAEGQVLVSKENCMVALPATEYIPMNAVAAVQPEAKVARLFPKESIGIQQAFYYAFSNSSFNKEDNVIRLYWNIQPASVAALLKEISTVFNHYTIPYIFKCLNNPGNYSRRDGAVLYVNKRFASMLNELLPRIHKKVNAGMIDEVPLLTKRLARGVGYADDPGKGQSFGMHRCQLIANGLLDAFQNGRPEPEDMLTRIFNQFQLAGINAEQPYLNAGSKYSLTSF